MASRYCGTLKITIALGADSETYSARIRELNDDARFETLHGLRLAPHYARQLAADSSEAYDHMARAALGFASYADDAIDNFAELDSDGSRIIRRRLGGPGFAMD